MCWRDSCGRVSKLRRQLLATPHPAGSSAGEVSRFFGAGCKDRWLPSGLTVPQGSSRQSRVRDRRHAAPQESEGSGTYGIEWWRATSRVAWPGCRPVQPWGRHRGHQDGPFGRACKVGHCLTAGRRLLGVRLHDSCRGGGGVFYGMANAAAVRGGACSRRPRLKALLRWHEAAVREGVQGEARGRLNAMRRALWKRLRTCPPSSSSTPCGYVVPGRPFD